METKRTLSRNIRVLMAAKALKRNDLMTAADVSAQTVTAWTSGKAMPGPDKLEKIAAFLGVPMAALFKE